MKPAIYLALNPVLFLPPPASECEYCGESVGHLYEDGIPGPRLDASGSAMCDECWHEHHEFTCIRCGNYDDDEDQHRYLVILEECGGMKPGIYRTRGAYFTSNYFDMWWNPWNLSRIRDADGDFYNEADMPSGHLCYGCRNEMGLTERTRNLQ